MKFASNEYFCEWGKGALENNNKMIIHQEIWGFAYIYSHTGSFYLVVKQHCSCKQTGRRVLSCLNARSHAQFKVITKDGGNREQAKRRYGRMHF